MDEIPIEHKSKPISREETSKRLFSKSLGLRVPEVVSDKEYQRYAHAAGNDPEIIKEILENGMACGAGEIDSTALKIPMELDKSKQVLAKPHKKRSHTVIIGLPNNAIDKIKRLQQDGTLSKERPIGWYFLSPDKTVQVPVGDGSAVVETPVIDKRFIEGYFSSKDGRFIKSDSFDPQAQNEFVERVVKKNIEEEKARLEKPEEEWWLDPDYQEKMGDPDKPRIP